MPLVRVAGLLAVDRAAGRPDPIRQIALPPVLALILPVALVLAVPLTYGHPGELSWIEGVYDECDYDDVIT